MLFAVLTISLQAHPDSYRDVKKSNLKILYIGQNPEMPDRYSFGNVSNMKTWDNEIKPERAQEFYKFFKNYFTTVDLVYGEDYNESLTQKYDVVIFDDVPRQLDGELTDMMKSWGKEIDYLSDDYDKPTIFIGGLNGPVIESKQTKIDVLCNCLDSHAYYYDEEHPIFTMPYKVPMDTEMRPPNKGVYSYYTGNDLPEKMPMLRMQNVDAMDYPPGVVTLPGFGDSPDAEAIASGPSIKMVEAVAIGRHGNFFQWGYRADPRHLTEAGKLALINSIHYIHRFKEQKPFVKRKNSHRLEALDNVYKASDKGYTFRMKSAQKMHNNYNSAKVRELAGASIPFDKYLLKQDSKFPDRTYYLKSVPKKIVEKYVDDWNAYQKYYEDNLGYIGVSEVKEHKEYGFKYQDFVIDEDLQDLGIANNDIQLLEKCITMLETNEQPEVAKKLLGKYTNETFSSAKEWRKWFKKNKEKLFFTETGGYKWMVNNLK